MGTYLNPGNSGFAEIRRSEYVDKSGLIGLVNDTIDTTKKLTCISRPRRFGKSFAAKMLCAYYDNSCDSHFLFDDLCIANDSSYEKHMNQYNVIYLDMTGIIGATVKQDVVPFIKRNVTEELVEAYPGLKVSEAFYSTLVNAVSMSDTKFVMIIDEWDAPIRENSDSPEIQRGYLEFLRSIFKNSGVTGRIFAAVYMTGILPIKKDGSQSAISDFREYTMIKPRRFGEYVGFTEAEVKNLCKENDIDFKTMKQWYDGYGFRNVGSVYNPNSVMQAIDNDDFDSYWTETSAAEGLIDYISKDYNGLSKTVAELIGGVDVRVSTTGFANDLTTFKGKDDILTLLIHLGYVAYDSQKGTVHIPNEEIRMEFSKSVREVRHTETLKRIAACDQLFYDTVHGHEEAVARQIEKIHAEETAPLHYNREESLRSVIKLAYYTYRDNYLQFEELPSGEGYADIVYLPKPDSGYPALVVELKWNQSAEGAIAQILNKRYPDAIRGCGFEILLVGVNYDKDAPAGHRKHTCRIVKLDNAKETSDGI